MSEPVIGRTYRHFLGKTYKVLHFALCSDTKQKLVVYLEETIGQVWVCPVSRWSGIAFSKDGTSHDKFKSEDTTT